ncbi:MAG: integration host factor [Acidimicrobiia bacterium]|nr:integration host factor [Acidimicrobiia bacterium]MYC57198.1 integration host factor [Acidimicrobiia bacterium]MYG93875.1 integration host factor [Acidimicrobiia bacterium]MYI29878.1 integration host factor [Acidimicrobiia bacterium]
MNKSELVNAISDRTGETKSSVEAVLNSLESVVTEQVILGEKVAITGFVSFEQSTRGARTGRNPRTGETLHIPAAKSCKVSAGARLKAAIKDT